MNLNIAPRTRRKRTWIFPLAAFLALSAGMSSAVRAGIIISVQSVNASAGAFDVFLTNTGLSAVSIDTTQFEISVNSAQVSLTQANISTTLFPYIFAGQSTFGSVISTTAGAQILDASDVYAAAGSVSLLPGVSNSLGLGHILFSVAGTLASPATVTINQNVNLTSLAAGGNNVPIDQFVNGTILPDITIVPVPEPAAIGQAAIAVLAGLFAWRRYGRRA